MWIWILWIFRKCFSFYPEERFIIETRMSNIEVFSKMKEATYPRDYWTSCYSTLKSFYGKVNQDGFLIRPALGFPYSQYLLPVIRGRFEQKENGTAIRIKLERPQGTDTVKIFFFLFNMLILPFLFFILGLLLRWKEGIVTIGTALCGLLSIPAISLIISNSFEKAKIQLYVALGLKKKPEVMKWE